MLSCHRTEHGANWGPDVNEHAAQVRLGGSQGAGVRHALSGTLHVHMRVLVHMRPGSCVVFGPPLVVQVGACIVNSDNIILSIGYNGFPRGCADSALPWSKRARSGSILDTKYPYVSTPAAASPE